MTHHSIGVFAKIFDEERRILLVRQNYGEHLWTTPGGRLEPGEDPIDGVIRETYEEARYVVTVEHLIGIYANTYKDDLVISFLVRPLRSEPWSPSDEIAEMRFFGIDDLPGHMSVNARIRVLDAFRRKKGVYRSISTRSCLDETRSLE